MCRVPTDICIDCNAGRRMGCGTFCCKLLVRLRPEDAEALYPANPSKRFIDKNSDGYCMYLDRTTFRCDIWEKRPSICR